MKIAIFPLGPLETNCYLVHNESEAVIIDVGGDSNGVLDYLKRNGLKLTQIYCTHLHFDHTLGMQELSKATGAPIHASEKDLFLLAEEGFGTPTSPKVDLNNLEPGQIPFLNTTCQVLATPGHTPGGLSFYVAKAGSVFVGDAIFYRSIGRTDFTGGDFNTLATAIRTQIFTLPDETIIYPGHGPHTTVGDEKRLNPFVGQSA